MLISFGTSMRRLSIKEERVDRSEFRSDRNKRQHDYDVNLSKSLPGSISCGILVQIRQHTWDN